MSNLTEGMPAPDFTLTTDANNAFSLLAQRGHATVLFFYPKDDTPGCTTEGIDFTRLKPEFEAMNVVVVGISGDSVEDHCKFRDKHDLRVPLLADPDHLAIDAYGVWGEKKNFGKIYMGLIRTTFLINPEGKIAKIWQVKRVAGHADAVLESVRALTV